MPEATISLRWPAQHLQMPSHRMNAGLQFGGAGQLHLTARRRFVFRFQQFGQFGGHLGADQAGAKTVFGQPLPQLGGKILLVHLVPEFAVGVGIVQRKADEYDFHRHAVGRHL